MNTIALENIGVIELRKKLLSKEVSCMEVLNYYNSQIDRQSDLNVFITVNDKAEGLAKKYDSGEENLATKKLGGIPIAIKDVFSTKGLRTTCASKILDNYIPVIESTTTKRIFDEGAIDIGKTNLDQFCHGSSTATSGYGPTRNPWNKEKLPGGSSGGSTAAVTADMCTAALGTETAGSIRQPSSWCGTVGIKPTYGRVSRYGVLAMGSSLDSPGPITKNVDDAAYLLSIISGHDENDFTSSKKEVPDYFKNLNPKNIEGLKIAIPRQYVNVELEEGVRKNFDDSVKILKDLGAIVEEVDLIDPKYSIAVYTLVCRSEVSSNLSRYDGTRYSVPSNEDETFMKYIESVRGNGFGREAKRRIMTGTFALSAGYADKYYRNAETVREAIKQDLLNVLKDYSVIISPTTPSTALGDKEADNPIFGEIADVLVEASSLAGLPGISVPNGFSNNLPTGLQIFGKHFDEQIILDTAKAFENVFGVMKRPVNHKY